jgi:exosortase
MIEGFERFYQLAFFSTAIAFVLLERIRILQHQPVQIAWRWPSNLGLFLIGICVTAVILPFGIYAFAERLPPGLMSRLGIPLAGQLLLTFLALDLWKYWEHRFFHEIPLLWRVHLVHHSDTHVDVTTAERHHPLEVLLSTALLIALVAALGLQWLALGLYLLTASLVALYSHANVRVSAHLDRVLRKLVVTARVHAVHHSDLQTETDSNYGAVLTLWDRIFGTYLDPEKARIPHFGLRYFHLTMDTRLIRVLQQPFLFRRNLEYVDRDRSRFESASSSASSTASTESPRLILAPGSKPGLLAGAAACGLVILAMWPALLQMMALWRSNESYQYAWLVMPMIAYLIGWHRPLSIAPRPDFSGMVVVMLGASCWVAATAMNIDAGQQFALVLSLHGVAMCALGWRGYWQLFPTLALTFLMIPSGDVLQHALRLLTLKSIELFAVLMGLPHRIDGFAVFIGSYRYFVIDECSGLSYVTLGAFLGYCFGLLLYGSLARTSMMALAGAGLGFASNVLRVNSIVLIDWIQGTQMPLTAHGAIQWVALFVALGALLYLLSRSSGDPARPPPQTAAPAQPHALRKLAPVVAAGLAGLFVAGATAGLQTHDPRAPRAEAPGLFQADISGWERTAGGTRWSVDKQGDSESIGATYRRNGHEVQIEVVEALSASTKLKEPAPAPDGRSVWREKDRRTDVGCAGTECVRLSHVVWQLERSERLRHV